ncbi:MAG: hypothetical protein KGL39_56680 [Patescibacteria group bacterium]|nr:hypothetical protein [Patescibacteria group bacterium]
MTNTEGAMEYRPTRRERFWRKLGFRYHLAELPDDVETRLPGWMITKSTIHFSFTDRIRLLLGGTLKIDIRQATSERVREAVSALSFRITYPGEQGGN